MTFFPPIRWVMDGVERLVISVIDCGTEIGVGYSNDESDVWTSERAKASIRQAVKTRHEHEIVDPEFYNELCRNAQKYLDEAIF